MAYEFKIFAAVREVLRGSGGSASGKSLAEEHRAAIRDARPGYSQTDQDIDDEWADRRERQADLGG